MVMMCLEVSALILASAAMLAAVDVDDVVPDEYLLQLDAALVKTDDDVAKVSEALVGYGIYTIKDLSFGVNVKLLHVNSSDDANVQRAVNELAEVILYERNGLVETYGSTCCCQDVSATETWGLDRIDQRKRLQSTDPFNSAAKYQQSEYKGAGVVAYIGDTGLDITHPQFEGRALHGFSIDGTSTDYDGHGTHVAGTVGSRLHGVAKEVTLVNVKVFSPRVTNSWANIIAGLRWIFFDHVDRQTQAGGVMPKSVVNLSLGGGINLCTEFAVNGLIGAGISVVVAAGNSNNDACLYTPARVPNAVTVGASTVLDENAGFSNWGRCVDIYGPGYQVMSTWPGNGKRILQGTSMATPHVAGAVALKMGKEEDALPPHVVAFWLQWQSTKRRLKLQGNHATSPNRLVYVDCKLRSPLNLVSP